MSRGNDCEPKEPSWLSHAPSWFRGFYMNDFYHLELNVALNRHEMMINRVLLGFILAAIIGAAIGAILG
jgi:hypothetical protein